MGFAAELGRGSIGVGGCSGMASERVFQVPLPSTVGMGHVRLSQNRTGTRVSQIHHLAT